MSDEVSNVDGIDEVMVVGEPAWHHKGIVLADVATSTEALQAAHLDWGVSKLPIFGEHLDLDGVKSMREIVGSFTVVRDDTWDTNTGESLGIVGNKYSIVQNVEAFNFFDSIVGEGKAIYHSAGALFGGRRIWVLAKLPDTIEVIGDDVVDQYVLLTNTHDGSSSLQTLFTPTRVVCWNTLSQAFANGSRSVNIRHTASIHDNLQQAARVMGIIGNQSVEINEVFQAMTKVEMTGTRSENYFNSIYPLSAEPTERTKTNHTERIDRLETIFQSSPSIAGVEGARGTLWGAYNAVTQHIDHDKQAKDSDKQMQRTIFGNGSTTKIKANSIA